MATVPVDSTGTVALDLHDAAIELLDSDALAHVVTLASDGSPQVSCVWVGVRADAIVFASMFENAKIRNLRRDPRISLSLATGDVDERGLEHYLVVHGRAELVEGGAPALLQDLAHTYLGPDVIFPAMPDPPEGTIVRITPDRVTGVGPWA